MKKLLSLALLLGALSAPIALVHCGGSGFSCDQGKKCPNDPDITDSQRQMCRDQLAGMCGDKYKAAGQCASDNTTCDSSGKSMTNTSPCQSQNTALLQCLGLTM
jgi:hypothetical protein